jgi:predicted nucleotidyltransferase
LAGSAAAVPAAAGPVEAGSHQREESMAAENSFPEKKLDEFIARLKDAAGDNLESLVLYGSAVTGEYDPEFSNINLLCFVRDSSFPKLKAISPVVQWWFKEGQRAPLLITKDELSRSSDVFVIELMDIRRQHKVLFGPDLVGDLEIPMHLHRAQLEYELREKLILLRQHLLLAANEPDHMWNLLLHSLPAFATLFRHAVIAQNQPVPPTKREAIKQLAASLRFDATAFENLLDVREHRANRNQFQVQEVAARYLAAVEQVTSAVDRMLDSPQAS